MSFEYNNLLLTLDMDWAPEHVLEDTYSLIKSTQHSFTVFCTHDSPWTQKIIALENVELGIHPNFSTGQEADVLGKLLSLFPKATFVRNHALYFHYSLYKLFWEQKLRVISNDLMFLQDQIRPYFDWSGMLRLPVFWEDDVHSVYFGGDFSSQTIDWKKPGLKVMSFHPVHLFLNTQHFSGYMENKENIKNASVAHSLRFSGKGVRTFFEELILNQTSHLFSSFTNITHAFTSTTSYQGQFGQYWKKQAERSYE